MAEAGGIARAVLAAAQTGARIHVRQINSALGVTTWRRLRDMADASVETTPQCLCSSRADDYETHGARPERRRRRCARRKTSPPCALPCAPGLIDIVATDHAPHSPAEKAAAYAAFADIPGGMPGVQTLLPAMLKLVDEGDIGLQRLVRMCAPIPRSASASAGARARSARATMPTSWSSIRAADASFATPTRLSRGGYTPFDGLDGRAPAAA